MPLYRKLPTPWINNYEHRTEIAVLNLGDLLRSMRHYRDQR